MIPLTDLQSVRVMLNSTEQHYFTYTQIGNSGNFTVLMLTDRTDDTPRDVTSLLFDVTTKKFIKYRVEKYAP